jgi:hypothetical protein
MLVLKLTLFLITNFFMKIEPENQDLWNRFRSCERNEMIITKSGRCLFPVLKFNVLLEESDLPSPNPNSNFSYGLGMERVDSYKWKYRDGHWFSLTTANSTSLMESNWHVYEPETSPSSWLQIMQEGLNFSKVKLTNRKSLSSSLYLSHTSSTNDSMRTSASNYFSLSSFGNYVPIVFLLNWSSFVHNHEELSDTINMDTILRNYSMKELENEGSLKVIRAHECSFIAVTHYQNELITHLKKHNNPHAKGFILTNEGIGRVPNNMPRGKPGRKTTRVHDPNSYGNLTYDVYLASKALERMSTLNVPRSEIINPLENIEFFIDNESEKAEHSFLSYYNKLK